MQDQHLAIASVPAQPWNGQLYDWDQAIKIGTIFPELNLPFFAAESLPGQIPPMAGNGNVVKTSEQEEREHLLARLNAISFALDDVVLFLDTHPQEIQAAQLRTKLLEERKSTETGLCGKVLPADKRV